MAKATRHASELPQSFQLRSRLLLHLILLAALPHEIQAHTELDGFLSSPSAVPTPTAAPTFLASPTLNDALAAASSVAAASSSMPSSTDTADYDALHNNNNGPDRDVLNYYFLLLVVFVIVIALVYWSVARRRHKRLSSSRNGQQSALARDLETWPRARRVAVGLRLAADQRRTEDGLNERGEAPPPYLKEPEPVHHGRGDEGVELHEIERREGKPPDYEEGSARR